MNISVCMATYNGEKYILEQINSILGQLSPNDEVIVVDDNSQDNTVKILHDLNDYRIKIYLNDRNMGHVFSFERAISLSINDIVFLSDQDDIWIKGRVLLMANKLINSGSLLVSSNYELMDMNGGKLSDPINSVKSDNSREYFKNILRIFVGKSNYYGCAMAFRKNMVKLILPIPSFVESHDLWISMASNLIGSNAHLDEKTLRKRLHSNNVSNPHRKLLPKLWSRVIFLRSIIIILLRARRLDLPQDVYST